MYSHKNLPALVRELAGNGKSNLFSLKDFAQLSELSAEECAKVLAAFVASGVLRKTITADGDVYYWLVSDPDAAEAGRLARLKADG